MESKIDMVELFTSCLPVIAGGLSLLLWMLIGTNDWFRFTCQLTTGVAWYVGYLLSNRWTDIELLRILAYIGSKDRDDLNMRAIYVVKSLMLIFFGAACLGMLLASVLLEAYRTVALAISVLSGISFGCGCVFFLVYFTFWLYEDEVFGADQ